MKLRQLMRHPLARSLATIVLVCLMAYLRAMLLHGREPTRPFLLFYPVVMVAAIFGGLWNGLLATSLACVLRSSPSCSPPS